MTIACNTIFRHKNKNLVNYFMKTTALTFATKYRSFGRNACELSVLSNRSIYFSFSQIEGAFDSFQLGVRFYCTE